MTARRARKRGGAAAAGRRKAAGRLGYALAAGLLAAGIAVLLLRGGRDPAGAPRHVGPPVPESAILEAGDVPEVDFAGMEPRVIQRLQEAREQVLEALASDEAWGWYGIVLDAHEIHDQALACYRVAHRLDPGEFRWCYFLARVMELAGGNLEEVVAMLREASRRRSDYAPLFVRLGDVLVRQGDHEGAREAFARAAEIDPSLARAHRGLGQALLSLRRADEALPHLETATRLLPGDGAAHAALARAYAMVGDREKGRAAAARSRELDQIHSFPDPILGEVGAAGISASICFRRARELMDRGDFRQAIPNLEIAAETLTDNPHVQVRLGKCFVSIGRPDRAMSHLRRALELRDELPDVHTQIGALLATRGNFTEAIRHYRRAIELQPDDVKTLALLASALAQAGDLDRALAAFSRAGELGALDAGEENNWGSTLARKGFPERAVPHFRAAIRLDPDFANARFNLGVALEGLGQVEAARREYEAAVRIDPRHRAARRLEALERSGG